MTVWTLRGAFTCSRPLMVCSECTHTEKASPSVLRRVYGLESLTPSNPGVVIECSLASFWCVRVRPCVTLHPPPALAAHLTG